jgi:Kef-type K+ transport system membrane component KefB/CBS domain-containing protein
MSADSLQIVQALAIILVASLVGGRLALFCRIPRVTGYLVAGLLIGPSFAHLVGLPQLIAPAAMQEMQLVSDIALALILMNIGAQLRTENLRRWKQRIFIFSFSEALLTGLLVAGAIAATNQFILQQTVGSFSLGTTSLLLGAFTGSIAIATAPAATLMVMREYSAEGPITSTVLTLVGLNNLLSVLFFSIAAQLLFSPQGGLSGIFYQLLVPVLLGAAGGLLMSFWAQRLELPSEHKILLLGGVTAAAVGSRMLGLQPLLTCLALGVVLADSSPRWHRLVKSLNEVDYPLYVIFFVLAGANLHLETLSHIGLLGVSYVLARTLGKLIGANLGARLGHFGQRAQSWVGVTLLAQAGMAIGLASTLRSLWPEGGQLIQTIILGSVVIFELFGPLAVRYGLVKSGEVPILSLLTKRAPQSSLEGLHNVVNHFRSNLGLGAGRKLQDPGDILVRHVMRHNVETINQGTHFQELLRVIAHSRYDRFPVVDNNDNFVGIIDYAEIRNLLFDQSLADLLVARDLLSPVLNAVSPDATLRDALQTLKKNKNISYFPVVDPDNPQKLLGILSQNDVLAAFRRLSPDQ